MSAAIHGEAVLLQRACRSEHCHTIFYICSHCDRGHRYCSEECRHQARLRQMRCANRRHQQSEEGRLDHRDRQDAYRQRQRDAQARVTDHGSISITSPPSLPRGQADAALTMQPPPELMPFRPRCRICGRVLRFINPYPRIPWRK